MTEAQRKRLEELRKRTPRRSPGGDLDFLLGLVDELQKKVGLFAANSSTWKDLGEAYEDAAQQEIELLRTRLAQLENVLDRAGLPVPPPPRTPPRGSA
jgi:hypothetical protein